MCQGRYADSTNCTKIILHVHVIEKGNNSDAGLFNGAKCIHLNNLIVRHFCDGWSKPYTTWHSHRNIWQMRYMLVCIRNQLLINMTCEPVFVTALLSFIMFIMFVSHRLWVGPIFLEQRWFCTPMVRQGRPRRWWDEHFPMQISRPIPHSYFRMRHGCVLIFLNIELCMKCASSTPQKVISVNTLAAIIFLHKPLFCQL